MKTVRVAPRLTRRCRGHRSVHGINQPFLPFASALGSGFNMPESAIRVRQALRPFLERLQLRPIAHVEGMAPPGEDVGFHGCAGLAVFLEEAGDHPGRAAVIVGHEEESRRGHPWG